MKYDLRKPCDNCPFRSDITPFIRPDRAEEIASSDGEFPCHKTTEFSDEEDPEPINRDAEHHCAGFLILREKIEQPSQMMRICERLGLYDRTKLDMDAPVYDSIEEMVEAHENATADL